MQARLVSCGRFIIPHPEHAFHRLGLVPGAPAGDERARQRGIEEVDRHGVVEQPAHAGRRHGPGVSAAVLVQLSTYLGIALTPAGRNADPYAEREAPFVSFVRY